jgi:hypothetical protein
MAYVALLGIVIKFKERCCYWLHAPGMLETYRIQSISSRYYLQTLLQTTIFPLA